MQLTRVTSMSAVGRFWKFPSRTGKGPLLCPSLTLLKLLLWIQGAWWLPEPILSKTAELCPKDGGAWPHGPLLVCLLLDFLSMRQSFFSLGQGSPPFLWTLILPDPC